MGCTSCIDVNIRSRDCTKYIKYTYFTLTMIGKNSANPADLLGSGSNLAVKLDLPTLSTNLVVN